MSESVLSQGIYENVPEKKESEKKQLKSTKFGWVYTKKEDKELGYARNFSRYKMINK